MEQGPPPWGPGQGTSQQQGHPSVFSHSANGEGAPGSVLGLDVGGTPLLPQKAASGWQHPQSHTEPGDPSPVPSVLTSLWRAGKGCPRLRQVGRALRGPVGLAPRTQDSQACTP